MNKQNIEYLLNQYKIQVLLDKQNNIATLTLVLNHNSQVSINLELITQDNLINNYLLLNKAIQTNNIQKILEIFQYLATYRFILTSKKNDVFLQFADWIYQVKIDSREHYPLHQIIDALQRPILITYDINSSQDFILKHFMLCDASYNQANIVFVNDSIFYHEDIDWLNPDIKLNNNNQLKNQVICKVNNWLQENKIDKKAKIIFWRSGWEYLENGSELECKTYLKLY